MVTERMQEGDMGLVDRRNRIVPQQTPATATRKSTGQTAQPAVPVSRRVTRRSSAVCVSGRSQIRVLRTYAQMMLVVEGALARRLGRG